MNIGIWGIEGNLGNELGKIFTRKDDVRVVFKAGSDSAAGLIDHVNIAFLALPAAESMALTPRLLKIGITVIDLSGAFRLKKSCDYVKFYKFEHESSDLLNKSVYGLPELNRKTIKTAKLIANPGCYATAAELGLLPVINSGLNISSPIIIRAFSGYTGASRMANPPKRITGYKNKGGREHQHIPEIEQTLNIHGYLRFYPYISPWQRGMLAKIYLKTGKTISQRSMQELYKEYYRAEPFIQIKDRVDIDEVIETNNCQISINQNNYIISIQVALDNLGKGGAGQAVQNFLIRRHMPENQIY